MKKRDLRLEHRAVVLLLTLLLVLSILIFKPFLPPLILASILVMLTAPGYQKLNHFLKNKRSLSAGLMTLGLVLLILLPGATLITILINQISNLIGKVDLSLLLNQILEARYFQDYGQPLMAKIQSYFPFKIDLIPVIVEFAKNTAGKVYVYSPQVLFGTATFIFNFFLMIIAVYVLFLEGPTLWQIFLRISPLRTVHEKRLSNRIRETIAAGIWGYVITGLVQGIMAGVLFWAVDVKAFVVLGALTFIMSMVPIIGATGVWLPVCLWFFAQGMTLQGFVVLGVGAIGISGIDNILKPMIIQGRVNIHPVLIFLSLMGGVKLFGPLGLLFGPVIVSMLIAVIGIYLEEIRHRSSSFHD